MLQQCRRRAVSSPHGGRFDRRRAGGCRLAGAHVGSTTVAMDPRPPRGGGCISGTFQDVCSEATPRAPALPPTPPHCQCRCWRPLLFPCEPHRGTQPLVGHGAAGVRLRFGWRPRASTCPAWEARARRSTRFVVGATAGDRGLPPALSYVPHGRCRLRVGQRAGARPRLSSGGGCHWEAFRLESAAAGGGGRRRCGGFKKHPRQVFPRARQRQRPYRSHRCLTVVGGVGDVRVDVSPAYPSRPSRLTAPLSRQCQQTGPPPPW